MLTRLSIGDDKFRNIETKTSFYDIPRPESNQTVLLTTFTENSNVRLDNGTFDGQVVTFIYVYATSENHIVNVHDLNCNLLQELEYSTNSFKFLWDNVLLRWIFYM